MELMHDGQPCPDFIQRMMNQPHVLLARAQVRLEIAKQDRQWRDTLAEWRNNAMAQEYLARASQGG